MSRPPLPPFTAETAAQKARLAEDAWNSRDPERVSLAYTEDSVWRNRAEFISGRGEIVALLTRKWARELDYRLIKEVWTWNGNRIAVRFAYEWHDDGGHWFRSYGNENWEFDEAGLMRRRVASINDLPIAESERKVPLAARPPAGRPSRSFRTRTLGRMRRIAPDRDQLLAMVAEVFREHGYEGASLALISAATGLGKGSLYHFFPGGKEEMAGAVIAHIDGWFEDNVFAPLHDSADPRTGIEHMLKATDGYFRSGRRVCLIGAFALEESRDLFANRSGNISAAGSRILPTR